jgi:exodeoxyribonuclease VII large subunit
LNAPFNYDNFLCLYILYYGLICILKKISSMKQHSVQRQIYTVSELTQAIRTLLEDRFSFVWLSGEISNFSRPVSGHYYFNLKDASSQINAVMFRGQNRQLPFMPEDGMTIVGLGRISVYEPRGSYQIILEYIEPQGVGALQVAFDQLKQKLADEGLFDTRYKKPLPFLPRKISVVTSPSGAVIHDILRVIQRRFPDIHIEVVPVKVQGDRSSDEITAALQLLNMRANTDVIILARGGGSLEDLQSFNSEKVARAVFASTIPVVSAIGHETDITIADFVADFRSATPSVAAELVVPLKFELRRQCANMTISLQAAMNRCIEAHSLRLKNLSGRLVDPKKRIAAARMRIDDFTLRLIRTFQQRFLRRQQERRHWWQDRLYANIPLYRVHTAREKQIQWQNRLIMAIHTRFNCQHAVLARGYSITRTIPAAEIVHRADSVTIHQQLEILLAEGSLCCRVEGIKTDGKKNI